MVPYKYNFLFYFCAKNITEFLKGTALNLYIAVCGMDILRKKIKTKLVCWENYGSVLSQKLCVCMCVCIFTFSEISAHFGG